MSDYLPNRDGLLRANVRDSIRRLKKIQKKAGKQEAEEEEVPSTGDPFTDISTALVILVTKTKLTINKKNSEQRLVGVDRMNVEQSVGIRRDIQKMESMVAQLHKMVEAAEKEVTDASRKKVKQSKLEQLQQTYEEKRGQYEDAVTTVDIVKEMNRELIVPGGDAATDITLNKKNLREQLSGLDFSSSAAKYREGADGNKAGITRIEDQEELKNQMETLREQDERIDAGLDRLRQGMARLKDLSGNIGDQLSMQNQMLEKTEENMNRQSQQLYNLTNRIGKLMKESSPINTFIYCCCVVLILAIVGFVLVQFGVI
eukprot:gene4146-2988_t